jgi:hypothetical protein
MAILTTEDLTGERSPSRLLRRIHKLLVTRVDSLFDDEQLTTTSADRSNPSCGTPYRVNV